MNYLFISESCKDCQNNGTVIPENCTCVCKNHWSGEKCGEFVLELTIDISSRTKCRNALFLSFTFFSFCFLLGFLGGGGCLFVVGVLLLIFAPKIHHYMWKYFTFVFLFLFCFVSFRFFCLFVFVRKLF